MDVPKVLREGVNCFFWEKIGKGQEVSGIGRLRFFLVKSKGINLTFGDTMVLYAMYKLGRSKFERFTLWTIYSRKSEYEPGSEETLY